MLWPHLKEHSITSHTGFTALFVLKADMHLKTFLEQRWCFITYFLMWKAKFHIFTCRNNVNLELTPNQRDVSQNSVQHTIK